MAFLSNLVLIIGLTNILNLSSLFLFYEFGNQGVTDLHILNFQNLFKFLLKI